MNTQDEKAFGIFLTQTKKVLSPEKLSICLEVQQALKKWGIDKSIDKVIVEKGFLEQKEIATLLREHKGGDEELIRGYRIIEKLGEGAMGEVYRAIDLENNGRPVAIKILFAHLAKQKATAQRFIQEARLCIEKLNHPNIVKGYEVGYEAANDFFFYAMELVEGGNLRKVLKEKGVFSEQLALHVLAQMASALDHAFDFNLVHRDIKPDNIILTPKGDAKLCDLGLARDWAKDLSLTRTGAVMGTPFYISPEAAAGQKLDSRSDIYSLGATLYHMVVGRVPFDGANSAVVLDRHRYDPLVPPVEQRPELSLGFSTILEMMMAKSPQDRYQKPSQIIEDIDKLKANDFPEAVKKLKKEFVKLKPRQKTQVMEAIPASDTEENPDFQESMEAIEEEKTSEKIIEIKPRHQDSVEEYRIQASDSMLVSRVEENKGDKILKPFFTSTEQRILSKAHGAQSKLLVIGAVVGGLGFVAALMLIYFIFTVLKNFFK